MAGRGEPRWRTAPGGRPSAWRRAKSWGKEWGKVPKNGHFIGYKERTFFCSQQRIWRRLERRPKWLSDCTIIREYHVRGVGNHCCPQLVAAHCGVPARGAQQPGVASHRGRQCVK